MYLFCSYARRVNAIFKRLNFPLFMTKPDALLKYRKIDKVERKFRNWIKLSWTLNMSKWRMNEEGRLERLGYGLRFQIWLEFVHHFRRFLRRSIKFYHSSEPKYGYRLHCVFGFSPYETERFRAIRFGRMMFQFDPSSVIWFTLIQCHEHSLTTLNFIHCQIINWINRARYIHPVQKNTTHFPPLVS